MLPDATDPMTSFLAGPAAFITDWFEDGVNDGSVKQTISYLTPVPLTIKSNTPCPQDN